jgi:preprotein translocase subunit SecA
MVARTCPDKTHFDEWDLRGLEEMAKEQFAVAVDLSQIQDLSREELENRVFAAVDAMLKQKEQQFTKDAFFGVTRIIYLQTIDTLWKEHLRDMDHLREGISLRGYAQKDPKQEYKKEGFNLFANMMATIGADVLQKACRVVITSETEDQYNERLQAQRERQRRTMQVGGPAQTAAPAAPAAPGAAPRAARPAPAPVQQTVRRETPKVGPNEPCPCGSGKKYKKCHGMRDAAAT